ncbi:phosphotransferase [Aquicoccus sp. G2-2]|uniref:phosphotransferase n=1 Tax=Aquicoccus sp. G2-2 TaxID=3092120 RepID=UPI00366D67AF
MDILGQDNIALHPEAALAALARLESLIGKLGLVAEAEEALRLVPGKRAVFAGRMAGQDAVFRLPLDAAHIKSFAAEWAELTRAHAYLRSGENQVPEPLYFDPDTGLFVTTRAPGTPLLTHMWRIEAPARAPLVARAAGWLHAYMAPTIETRGVNRRPWRNWAAKAADKQPHAALREIESRILQKMHQLSRKMGDPDWRVAIPHGDFHLNNLIVSGTCLTGVDTGASNHAPIYKDMARALTHMARRGMLPSGRRRFGVDEAALTAFAETFALSETEQTAFLPYLIAFETLIKVEHPQMSAERIAHALSMSEALFQDLRQIS